MNINNLITIQKKLCNVETSQVVKEIQNTFVIGCAHINDFIDCYYGYLVVKYIDLGIAINKTSKVPNALLKGKFNIEKFKDGELSINL